MGYEKMEHYTAMKKKTAAGCIYMDDSHGDYDKEKKSGLKTCILYDLFNMKVSRTGNCSNLWLYKTNQR